MQLMNITLASGHAKAERIAQWRKINRELTKLETLFDEAFARCAEAAAQQATQVLEQDSSSQGLPTTGE